VRKPSAGLKLGAGLKRSGPVKRLSAPTADAASVAVYCAVLLRGGVPQARVLSQVAADTQDPGAVAAAARISAGAPTAEALAAVGGVSGAGLVGAAGAVRGGAARGVGGSGGAEWRVLAVAWQLAERSGAPLAPALERIAAALQALTQLRERRDVLLAGPRLTVRMVAALPPLALVLGALLGFDPVPVLLSPIGALLLAVGSALLVLGVVWARSLGRRVEGADRVAGLELELTWIALSGGAPPSEALVRVADCVSGLRATWVPFEAFTEGGRLRAVLATAAVIGVPVGPLLLEQAEAARAKSHAELERDAERLAVRVLIPLGVCVLPAFIALGVLPVLLSMLGGLA